MLPLTVLYTTPTYLYLHQLTHNHILSYPAYLNMNLSNVIGFCLLFALVSQVFTGLLLTSYYVCSNGLAWSSILNILIEVHFGFLVKNFHVIGAFVYMLLLLGHWLRAVYMNTCVLPPSYLTTNWVWYVGWVLFLMSIIEVFVGYILNWGNMSYWGILVIIQILASLPVIGVPLSELIWCHSSYVLNRLLTLHFSLGLVLLLLVTLHILTLHVYSSTNNLSYSHSSLTLPFYIYLFKDLYVCFSGLGLLSLLCCINPIMFGECDNNNPVEVSQTPLHILPVFSVLFVYLFVKVINSKLLALGMILCMFYGIIVMSSSLV
jgi:ubiquinol-cytochrome c reductase cytochrome b subunit